MTEIIAVSSFLLFLCFFVGYLSGWHICAVRVHDEKKTLIDYNNNLMQMNANLLNIAIEKMGIDNE